MATPLMPKIPGVAMCSTFPSEPANIVVLGPEKSGKSALTTSLIGYQGKFPIVIAVDKTGADTCANLGKPVPVMRPGDRTDRDDGIVAKTKRCLDDLARHCTNKEKPFNALVFDCFSTFIDQAMTDAVEEFVTTHEGRRPKDKRQIYGTVLDQGREVINRVISIGLPVFWLTWLQPAYIEESVNQSGQKFKKTQMGGPMVDGQKLRALLAGKAHQILVLEKVKVLPKSPSDDGDGYKRLLHTKTWDNIEAGGRYSSKLPEPCPPNLAFVLECMTRRVGE